MNGPIRNKWRWLVAVGAVFVPALVSGSFNLPFTFTSGAPIRASEVNANFEALRARMDSIQGASLPNVGTLTIAGALTSIPLRGLALTLSVPVALGKPALSDLDLTSDGGSGTPSVLQGLSSRGALASADIVIGNLTIHLTNVLFHRFAIGALQPQAGLPIDSFSLDFSKLDWRYPQSTGTAVVSYDRATNSVTTTTVTGFSTGLAFGYFGPGVTPDPTLIPILGYSFIGQCPDISTGNCGKLATSPISIQRTPSIDTLNEINQLAGAKRLTSFDLQWFATPTITQRVQLTNGAVTAVKFATNPDGSLTVTTDFSYSQAKWTEGAASTTITAG